MGQNTSNLRWKTGQNILFFVGKRDNKLYNKFDEVELCYLEKQNQIILLFQVA